MDGKVEMLTARPSLHCPDIDAYDEISVDQVNAVFAKKKGLAIGDKIEYTGIIAIFLWLISKKFVYQFKFSMLF